jgi:hypothetical protein
VIRRVRWMLLLPFIALVGLELPLADSVAAVPKATSGTPSAWGYNYSGQLGNGTNTNSNVPVQVSGLTGAVALAGGAIHGLAARLDGTVWAWGFNGTGQLGNGTNTNSNVPVQVSGLTGAVALAGGLGHSLAARSDGTVWAWGRNFYGQLGNGTNTDSNVPVQVSGLTGAVAVAGGSEHSLAARSDGTAWAWGFNSTGQLGNGTNANSNVPVQVNGLSNAIAVASGGYQSLALRSNGTVWTWGWNAQGQLGNGTNSDSNVPVQAIGLTGIHAVAGGGYHSLAIGDPPTAPVIEGLTPTKAHVGQAVTIAGANLGTATLVRFSPAVNASFTVVSDTEIQAVVPEGALTGPISVRTPVAVATSAPFSILPKITGFSPQSGAVGTSVTITGSALTGALFVRFNGTVATFTIDSYTQITATVPAGATTGRIIVRTAGGMTRSAQDFTVT